MNVLFELLLMLGALSVLFGVLGLFANLAEKTDFLWCWVRRVFAGDIF